MLKVSDLRITYPGREKPVIDNLSFQLPAGSLCLLHGGSGSGKTTLCLALAGLLQHACPEALIDGSIMWKTVAIDHKEFCSKIAITLENPYTQLSDVKSTVEGEIAFGLEMRGVPPYQIKTLISTAASTFGISHLLSRNPHTLSGGEIQRVVIACSYVLAPELWILDRPLTELDAPARVDFLNILKTWAVSKGTLIILSEEPSPDIFTIATHQLSFDNGNFIINNLSSSSLSIEKPLSYPLGIQFTKTSLSSDSNSSQSPDIMVMVKNLSFRYAPELPSVLENINLTICSGECLWITGANGCGKTTLAKLLMGILKLQKGEIIIDGIRNSSAPLWETARHISYAFQNPDYQIFSTTVWDEVAFGPKSLGYPHDKCAALTADALRLFGLTDKKEVHPHDLSRSEKKRLGLASTFSMDTPVLILDEPTQYQDAKGKDMVTAAMEMVIKNGKCLICITHDLL